MATQEKTEVLSQIEVEVPAIENVQPTIEKLIYIIRDKQVMVDSDLAMLYQVENRSIKQSCKKKYKEISRRF